ncbi:MAG: TetR/AcrR family transcriptional regulator [Pseudomonadota bacterium]
MPTSTNKRPRGRPPAFDKRLVAERIIDTFWSRGFSATSLDHLSEATGLYRPSLYAAFGDKKSMYREALRLFAEQLRAEVAVALARPGINTSLKGFYRAAIEVYTGGESGPKGCLFVCTTAAESAEDRELRADLAAVLKEIDSALAARFKQAQADGELSTQHNAATLGRLAGAVLHSLAVRARAGESKASLKRLAEATVTQLLSLH